VSLPLAGVTVLDLTRVLAGPYATMVLGDLGADVIKALLALAARSDVVVENFRPGTAERLGCGYDAVRAVRPDVIYCSISGFGQTGPYAQRPAYDIIAQGISGFLSMTGHPGGPPAKSGIALNDIAGGVTAV
jgi:crotonobetainyl-CoA:carnitine CoA-transferase CaiB-like acyl-CoA transferase